MNEQVNNEVIEGNKLIAEFMSAKKQVWEDEFYEKYIYFRLNNSVYPINKLEYHSSWDWLMPVVEKIESLGYQFKQCRRRVEIFADNVPVSVSNPRKDYIVNPIKGETKIESAWIAVVDFIKFHITKTKIKNMPTKFNEEVVKKTKEIIEQLNKESLAIDLCRGKGITLDKMKDIGDRQTEIDAVNEKTKVEKQLKKVRKGKNQR